MPRNERPLSGTETTSHRYESERWAVFFDSGYQSGIAMLTEFFEENFQSDFCVCYSKRIGVHIMHHTEWCHWLRTVTIRNCQWNRRRCTDETESQSECKHKTAKILWCFESTRRHCVISTNLNPKPIWNSRFPNWILASCWMKCEQLETWWTKWITKRGIMVRKRDKNSTKQIRDGCFTPKIFFHRNKKSFGVLSRSKLMVDVAVLKMRFA